MSHRVLNPEQFDISQEFGVHPSLGGSQAPDVVHGRAARHIMAQADIRQTKKVGETPYGRIRHDQLVQAPHVSDAAVSTRTERGYPEGEVWTSQSHLHLPTLKRYAQGRIPKFDPDYDIDESGEPNVPYEPETYEHGGKTWLEEGHHRTVATRLAR